MYVVSACLAGCACRYDGRAKADPEVLRLIESGEAVAVCPEVLGGLPVPRTPGEMRDGRVLTRDGEDITDNYVRGAEKALEIANAHGCTRAVLKARSPSCGCGEIYDGSFTGTLTGGNGVFARMLLDAGFEVTCR